MGTISNDDKLDILWKKIQYGVSETTRTGKTANEERVSSPLMVFPRDVWAQADKLPTPPRAVPNLVQDRTAGVRCIIDPTVTGKKTWFAIDDYSKGPTDANRLKDWIPFLVHPLYTVKLYKKQPFNADNRILPGAPGLEWVFDHVSGVIHFPNGASGLSELWVTGYRYIGIKGIDATIKPIKGMPVLEDYEISYENEPDASLGEWVLSDGFSDTSGLYLVSPPTPGEIVKPIIGNQATSNPIGPFGPSDAGTLALSVNGSSVGSILLKPIATGTDIGINGSLEIIDESVWKSPQGNSETIVAKINSAPVLEGLNELIITQNSLPVAISSMVFADTLALPATVTNIKVEEYSAYEPVIYRSGIPYYTDKARLFVSAKVKNTITNVFNKDHLFELTGNHTSGKIFDPVLFSAGLGLIPALPVKGSDIDVVKYQLDLPEMLVGSVSHTLPFEMRARNVLGYGPYGQSSDKVNVYLGSDPVTSMTPMRETGLWIDNLGSGSSAATRIKMPSSEKPSDGEIGTYGKLWDPKLKVASHEAKVVGTVLRWDNTDYSVGFLPVGPDYSNDDDIQWFSVEITRSSVSEMIIDILGTYSKLYVKLAGITNIEAINGWFDCQTYYQGWGTPGDANNGDGCLLRVETLVDGTERRVITFGQFNSSMADDYKIYVRIGLEEGQVITGLRFLGVENHVTS